MLQVVPAILATTEAEYQEQIERLWLSGDFDRDWVQIDLMDGKFVPQVSVSPEIVKKYKASFKYEVHLMVENPHDWVVQFKDFPSVLRFIVPIETEQYWLEEFISFTRAFTDAEIGFSFNPETPINRMNHQLMIGAESLLIMSVHPGASGQALMVESLDKVREAASLVEKNDLDCLVGIDGGISKDNIKKVRESGADYAVIGSHLLKGNIDENLEALWEALR